MELGGGKVKDADFAVGEGEGCELVAGGGDGEGGGDGFRLLEVEEVPKSPEGCQYSTMPPLSTLTTQS